MISLAELSGNKTSAGLLLLDSENRIGLVYKRKKRKIALPYGGIEKGQSPYEAALVETWQEMGATATVDSLLGIYKIQESNGGINVRYIYKARRKLYLPFFRDRKEIEHTYFLTPEQIRQIPIEDICRPSFMYAVLRDYESRTSYPILRRISKKTLSKYPHEAFTYLPNTSEDHSDEI